MNIDGVDISLDNLGQDLLELLVGERWPNGDEGAMRSLASAWTDAANQLEEIRQTASAAASQVSEYCKGANAESFQSFWSANFDDRESSWPSGVAPAALPFAVKFCQSMANALNAGANQIETTKDTIMGNIAILVATVAPQIAAGFFDFGATDATALAEIAADRTVIEIILNGAKELITEAVEQAIEQGLMQAELNFAIQFKEVAEGHASSINWSEVEQSGIGGAEGGALGAAFGFGLGKVGGQVFGKDFGSSFADRAAVGVASGSLTSASLDLLENGKISASDFAKGSLAGVLGGMGGAEAAAGERPAIDIDDLPTESDTLQTPALPATGDAALPTDASLRTDLSGLGMPQADVATSTGTAVSDGAATTGADTSGSGISVDPSQAYAASSSIARILGGGGGTEDAGIGGSSGYDGFSGSAGSGSYDSGSGSGVTETRADFGGTTDSGLDLGGMTDGATNSGGYADSGSPISARSEPASDSGFGTTVSSGADFGDGASTASRYSDVGSGSVDGGVPLDNGISAGDRTMAGYAGDTAPARPAAETGLGYGSVDHGSSDSGFGDVAGQRTGLADTDYGAGSTAGTGQSPGRFYGSSRPDSDSSPDTAAGVGVVDPSGFDTAGTRPADDGPSTVPAAPTGNDRSLYPDSEASAATTHATDPTVSSGSAAEARPPGATDQPAPRPSDANRPTPADPTRSSEDGVPGQNDQAQEQQPQLVSAGEPGHLITAASVPGSGFRGHAEAPTAAHIDQVRGGVDSAVHAVVDAYPGLHADPVDPARGVYRITDDSGVYTGDQRSFTVRVETQRLGDDTAARSILNHDKGEHVIQISDQISENHVPRAVAHEIGEIVADRQRYIVDKVDAFAPDEGNLRPDGPVDNVALTPHDAGRVQELRVLGEQLDRIPPEGSRTPEQQAEYQDTHREAMALVEHLGLRDGTPGAAERRALALDPQRLDSGGQAHVEKLLADAGAHPDTLSTDDRSLLQNIHDQARVDQSAFDAHRAGLRPDFERPVADGGGRIDPARMRDLADQATRQRAERSRQTLEDLRRAADEAAQDGEYPKVSFQAGGGAALSGRDPGALLVDDRNRWQSDNGDRIAQTADQLRNLRQTGLGDPYQFVGEHNPGERVPLAAVRYWEDDIAAQGPVIDGTATFRTQNGRLLADISPADGSPKLTVEVEGTPVIASGFPPEIIPGIDRSVGGLHGSFNETARALDRIGTPDALAAKGEIEALSWRDPASAGKTLDILAAHNVDRSALPDAVNHSLDAVANWKSLRETHPGQVISGDEANLTGVDPDAAKEWIVAGTGGTGISGVENMLKLSPDAQFTMIGRNAPPGLGDNTQWKQVRGQHDLGFNADDPTAASTRNPDGTWPNPNATGRLTMAFEPDMNITGIEDRTGPDGARFAVAGYEGDGVIASLGTRNSVPPAVADMVDTAIRQDPSSVSGRMLFDDDGQYLGYRITVEGKTIDVTGAASRFFPAGQLFEARPGDIGPLPAVDAGSAPGTVWSTAESRYALSGRTAPGTPRGFAAQTGSNRDAPPEGGNFDGGYVATATQTSHYAAWRRRGTDPQPMPSAP